MEPVAVLHEGVPHEAELGFPAPPLAIEPCLGIRDAPVRVVTQPLAVKVHLGVAPAGRRLRRVGRGAVLGPGALHRGRGLDQRAVHAEVVLRQEPFHPRDGQHGTQNGCHHAAVEQAVAVLGKGRGVPDGIVDAQADEPAEQQIEVELLHQLALGADRIEGLQQHRP